MFAGIIAKILVTGLLLLVFNCFSNYRKLPHIPGPWLAKVSELWLLYHTIKGDVPLATQAAVQKYGSVFRIAPDYVVTDDYETLKASRAPRNTWKRGRWYDAIGLGAEEANVMTIKDDKAHLERRKKLLPGISGAEVSGLEDSVDKHVAQLLATIRRDHTGDGSFFNLHRLANFFTLDVVTSVAFGLSVGFLEKNEDLYTYRASSEAFYPILELCCNHAFLFKLLNHPLVLKVMKPRPEQQYGQGPLIKAAHDAVRQYFEGNTEMEKEGTMIASFKRHGLTQKQCEDEAMLQILGGSDSTATALTVIVQYVVTHPRVYLQLNTEINNCAARDGRGTSIVPMKEVQSLPYLQAVIKEALRVCPPLYGLVSRYPTTDIEIDGKHIPAGTDVGYAFRAIHRSERHWGPSADMFLPERWMSDESPELRQRETMLDALTFSSGNSHCLGRQIALMELNKAVFELFRNFDIQIKDPFADLHVRRHNFVIQNGPFVHVIEKQTVL